LSDLDILQSRPNYHIHVIKSTEKGNPLKKDFLAYIKPATDEFTEKKTPVALYQGVWHSLKYTSGLNEKLVYISEPFPEIHNYDVKVPIQTHNSESEPEPDTLDVAIHQSPAILKEPLAPTMPITQTPFFTITKSDFSQSITGTNMTTTQTTTQTATQATAAPVVTAQHPLTEYELEELLNVAMGEQGGGTGGNPPGPPGGGGPAQAAAAAAQPVAAVANVKAMGKDPPLFKGE